MTDILADLIARINNGQLARKSSIFVKKSKFCISILEILEREGFIRGYKFSMEQPYEMIVLLKYSKGKPVIQKFKKISKKSSRVYTTSEVLWRIKNGLGIYILSTTKGVVTDRAARTYRLGGEVLAYIE